MLEHSLDRSAVCSWRRSGLSAPERSASEARESGPKWPDSPDWPAVNEAVRSRRSTSRSEEIMKRPTTILVEEDETGWRATQQGVDLVGRGDTAARAAANYCELVDETVNDQQIATDGGER